MSIELQQPDIDEIFFQPPLFMYPDPETEDGIACVNLPFSNLWREWLPEDSAFHDVERNSTFNRLGNVKALSFLSFVGVHPEINFYQEFVHTREDHSYVVARVGELMLRRNGFPESEINKAVIAYMMHDIATPALGDATMKMDEENLSEEDNFRKVIGEKEQRLFEKYGTSVDEIVSIVKNEGVLGEVLDIADRLTYTAKDMHALYSKDKHILPGDQNKHDANFEYLGELLKVVGKYPNFGDLYKTVGIDKKSGKVFFSEPEMLAGFLHIRALLHEKLYLHPVSQGRDLLVRRLVEPLYKVDGDSELDITPENLRIYTDRELMKILTAHYIPAFYGTDRLFEEIVNWFPKYAKFESQSDADEFARELSTQENTVVLGVKKRRGFNPGTGYLVIHPITRRVLPLREYDPRLAQEPERIASGLPAVFVYYKELEDDGLPITDVLRNAPQFKTY